MFVKIIFFLLNLIFIATASLSASDLILSDDLPPADGLTHQAVVNTENIEIIHDYNIFYSHKIELDLIRMDQSDVSFSSLIQPLNNTQHALNDCGIKLIVKSATTYKSHPSLLVWEDLEFSNEITKWENFFFQDRADYSTGVVIVDTINWSDDPELYHGIGYAPFLADNLALAGAERNFYLKKIAGHLVISRYFQEHTIAHEIGHAIFNLRHHPSVNNIMYPSNKKDLAVFSREQCQLAIKSPRVIPLDY
ncbi:MAG: hypothetical protein HN353_12920 [Bdellovibrionales bacterium]|jgi:hypothetical protein|nr:hypothetical protein [Bdellovibrionales bacterium]MBT3525305.1 hypothetical protein [Bdellovibrionales bacterium]MBT7668548.1 hypothetical protein [Bdellovibrionales bacterium]